MELSEYQILASRTARPLDFKGDLQHALLGITSEAGEIADTIKRHIIYNAPIDIANIAEEIGDAFWYYALLANTCNLDLSQILDDNIFKLKKRYPEKYSDEDALARADKAEMTEVER